jgi:glycerol-3-phosphate acyltransferase PlsY
LGIVVAVVLVPFAYALGMLPSAVMVARSRGVDILRAGSGNPGASNVARVMGGRWGALVFLIDAAKGAIPAGIGLLVDSRPGGYVLLTAAVLGHMFPLTRHLRGGKGVATTGGGMLVLHPVVSLMLLALWLFVRRLSGKASLASLLVTVGLPVGVAIVGAPAWEVLAIIALGVLVMVRHLDNIKRLVAHRELSATRR